ncbi:YfbM family protein [Streptomyces sp. PLK6-54]|uniref:YfbM family protein n=2 Tax=Actinacidiphila acidipaludis TaxID=2873382 RepID=A0ABS7QAM4_9ACTN|nr:YfbM family protein [Streptomyces acidipaludis]
MIGEYLRVTAAQLDRAIHDPDWAWTFVEQVQDAEEESEPAPTAARHFSTYKTWDLLRFLLERAEFPVDVIHGEEPFAEQDNWGYGPPRYLPSERVRIAAHELRAITYDQLVSGIDPADLTKAEVYPLGWDEPGALEWGRHWHEGLTQFLEAAAAKDDAVLVWLD